ncbi:cell adhesion molecule 3-like [Ptychodera flava]|uniref:cell adhesion molecule 3-like n=1 Tax=Ptychodera flava TaxID=63121 RepID=UPI00396A4C7A
MLNIVTGIDLFNMFSPALIFFVVFHSQLVRATPEPRFDDSKGPKNVSVVEGESAVFRCRLNVNIIDPYSIQWTFSSANMSRHGSVINRDENYNISSKSLKASLLTVKSAAKPAQGWYRCSLLKGGNATTDLKEAYLRVISRPSFRQEPSDQTVVEGENVTLHCQLDKFNDDIFYVSWFRNGSSISRGHISPQLRFSAKSSDMFSVIDERESGVYDLSIANISKTRAEKYHCRIYHADIDNDIERSRNARIKVLYPPKAPYPRCETLTRNYTEGDMLQTECWSRGGNAPVYFQWVRDGVRENGTALAKAGKSSRQGVNDSWSLTAKDDGSHIVCSMTGPAISEKRECSIGPISVHYGPIISVTTDDIQSNVGDNVTVNCSVRSNPKVEEYFWFVNGDKISSSTRYQIVDRDDGSVLIFQSLKETDDDSLISCQAGNNETVRASVRLNVSKAAFTEETTETAPSTSAMTKRQQSTFLPLDEVEPPSHSGLAVVNIVIVSIAAVVLVAAVSFIVYFRCRKTRLTKKEGKPDDEPENHESRHEAFVSTGAEMNEMTTEYEEIQPIKVPKYMYLGEKPVECSITLPDNKPKTRESDREVYANYRMNDDSVQYEDLQPINPVKYLNLEAKHVEDNIASLDETSLKVSLECVERLPSQEEIDYTYATVC